MGSVDLKQMHRISIVWGSILLIIVIGLTFMGFYLKHNTKVYRDYEKLVAEKTKDYVLTNSLIYGKTVQLKLEDLIENKVIDSNIVNDKECKGYVEIEYMKESQYNYKTYLQCGKYKTRGYKKI